ECALHGGMVYGLVAPGYDMAETVAANLAGGERSFQGTDLSTKLKLMGIDVASFGDYEAPLERAIPLSFEDPFAGFYKKLLFSTDGAHLLGGILVGDASDYATLAALARGRSPLPMAPHELVIGSREGAAAGGIDGLPDEAQICSCNNVTKAQICDAIEQHELDTPAAVRTCT